MLAKIFCDLNCAIILLIYTTILNLLKKQTYSITKSPVTQQDIDKAIVDYNATSDIAARVVILNKLFSEVTAENFVNFTTDTSGNTITLKALPNFAFGTQPTISARVVTAA